MAIWFGYGTGQRADRHEQDRPRKTPRPRQRRRDVDAPVGLRTRRSAATSSRTSCGSSARTTASRSRTTRPIIRAIKLAPGTPGVGTVVPLTTSRQTFAGKLTYNRLGNNQTLVGSLIGDPTKLDGAIFAIAGPASTWQGTIETGGIDGIVRYNGTFRNTWLVEASVGRHNEKTTYGGAGITIPQPIDQTVSPNALTAASASSRTAARSATRSRPT